MADQMYNGDFFLDSAVIIKQEPLAMEGNPLLATASVPIPTRRGFDISDFRDYGFELSNSNSPHLQELTSTLTSGAPTLYQSFSQSAMWGGKTSMDMDTKCEPFHMDDDDIFQVDKADLIQGPTLAELNANDDTLLEDLNFDDLLLPEENSFYINTNSSGSQMRLQTPPVYNSMTPNPVHNNSPSPGMFSSSSFPQSRDYRDGYEASSSPLESTNYSGQQISTPLSPPSHHSSTSSLLHQSVSSVTPPLGQKHSTLHELLLKKGAFSSDRSNLGQSVPGPSSPITHGSSSAHAYGRPSRMSHSSQLSSSAPTHLGLEQVWQRREPRKHLLSTGSLAEAGSTSSLSTGGVLSPEAQDFSHDDGFDTEDDSDHYEDFSSDNDSDPEYHAHQSQSAPKLILSPMNKKERYFWQYNVQAKGPKGQRLVLKTRLEDPHILNEITDPVFSPNCAVRGIKHSGKARKGDGNDLTPNPRKLYNIGKELDKLSRVINDMTPVSELPFNVRPKTRKEKNKLASRACRLKKKAQHEANKLKLYGLEHEHRRLINGISQMKQILAVKLTETSADNQEELNQHIDKVIKSATKIKIAGHSTDYVNKVLDKVKSGLPGGGGFDDF